ncbi:hypothetical protein SRRS_38430 [Sporomusa rhizae]|uniref:methyl-accepting chemotaxis protein n=1 Tax=Sporomusa rhizae TaxID=357999 RepID=UPI00352A2598
MKWTVGKKISAGFLLVLVLVILMSGYSYWKIGVITASYQEFSKVNIEKIEMVQGAASDIANEAVVMRRYNFVGDPNDIPIYNSYKAKASERLMWLEKNLTSQKAKENLDTMRKEKLAYEEIAEKSMAAKQSGRLDEVATYMSEAGKPYKATMRAAEDLVLTTKEYVKQEQEKYAAEAEFSRLTLVIVNIIVIIMSIFVSYYVSRSISRPIRQVAECASKIAAGDLSIKTLEYKSDDEIGQLARAFNQMLTNLRSVIHQVAGSAELVAASSQELTSSAEHSAHSVIQVAANIAEVAAGAEKLRQNIADTANNVERVTAGIQQVAANANSVTAVSDKTAIAASNGGQAVEVAIRQMSTIDKTVEESAAVVAQLGERSGEIGQIVNTISNIAGQTNLLALNAAIEAARAGEQGRGFAVVAEEVRKLAEQSQEAAKTIATLIQEIQAETEKAVMAMNNGTREVRIGTDVVNIAGKSLTEISQLVQEVSSQVKDISVAIQDMATGSQQIVVAIRDIDGVGLETSSRTQTVSAATQEQSASMQQIASSSEALASMAGELQEVIAKFKL